MYGMVSEINHSQNGIRGPETEIEREPFSILGNNKYYELRLESEGFVDELVRKRGFKPKRRVQTHDLWIKTGLNTKN